MIYILIEKIDSETETELLSILNNHHRHHHHNSPPQNRSKNLCTSNLNNINNHNCSSSDNSSRSSVCSIHKKFVQKQQQRHFKNKQNKMDHKRESNSIRKKNNIPEVENEDSETEMGNDLLEKKNLDDLIANKCQITDICEVDEEEDDLSTSSLSSNVLLSNEKLKIQSIVEAVGFILFPSAGFVNMAFKDLLTQNSLINNFE